MAVITNQSSNEAEPETYVPSEPVFDPQLAERFAYWTEIDGDLADLSAEQAQRFRMNRYQTALFDLPRSEYWHDPDSVDAITDIAYLPDGGTDRAAGQCRGHLLDIYLPHEATVRGGHATPVYIDIHGGGFTYGYKELNRNFNTHLASRGFAVVSLNYRPAPQTDLKGQLADVQAALRWLRTHLIEYPVNPDAVFLTGDSAGGALALLTLAIENSAGAAHAFGIEQASGLRFSGGALICGVYSLASPAAAERTGGMSRLDYDPSKRFTLEQMLGEEFFAGLDSADPTYLTAEGIVSSVDLPPLFILTSSDDFLEADALALATAMSRKGADFELSDRKVGRHETLGHVYPIGMTWLDESQQALDAIARFSFDRC
ncbi:MULTISPECIES: alpha/beta hydrolase [Bifidobacterium]|uniref:alpha/beta hydrolase n=1 Tax=Bifidobacterium TaxID=1678 RepID=UPI001BDC288B|nr:MULTISPECIES: alpha/beta hydrolase [Bifidobacterium]MBT1160991.1 alpha/beta hydrolase [Bifidobacterium sp. SO1]MBW3079521.1 alpha/beta hydrolase [Bifidobacterium simiiventris]